MKMMLAAMAASKEDDAHVPTGGSVPESPKSEAPICLQPGFKSGHHRTQSCERSAIERMNPKQELRGPSSPRWEPVFRFIGNTLRILSTLHGGCQKNGLDGIELSPWLPGFTYGQFKSACQQVGDRE